MADKLVPNPRIGTPSENTKHLQNKILEMYRDMPNFVRISQELELSPTYVKKLYRQALKAIIVDNVTDFRKLELERLDKLYAEVTSILHTVHPVVNSGAVVRDVVDGPDGQPVLDGNQNPVTVRLADSGPRLAAIDKALKIMERRAKLLGLDAPNKTALTDPTGEKEASYVQFYLPDNGRGDQPQEQSSEADPEEE